MKKIWSGKALTAAIAGAVILALAFVIVRCLPYFMSDFSADKRNVMLSGKYSVDGGEWKSIGPETEIRDHFQSSRAEFLRPLTPPYVPFGIRRFNLISKYAD